MVTLNVAWRSDPADLPLGEVTYGYIHLPAVMPTGDLRFPIVYVELRAPGQFNTDYRCTVYVKPKETPTDRLVLSLFSAGSLNAMYDYLRNQLRRLAQLCNFFRGFEKGEYGYVEAV